MQLHQLISTKKKKRARVGRGGKRGTYSGRGQKGQKSRAGRRIRPTARDLILRLPKRRGFRNKPKKSKPVVFNLETLVLKIRPISESGKGSPLVVDREFLKQASLLPDGYGGEVKILGGGELNFPLELRGLKASKSVKMKVKKAGGEITP